jgi:PadR family transcriptional regulator PadR
MHAMARPAPLQNSADKWEVQLRKGSLELAILAAHWTGPLYGLEIIRHLQNEADLIVPEGTVYPLLNRLRTDGLLSSEWVEAKGGHPRKYYRLTAAGRRRVIAMARFWKDFSDSVNYLLAPLEKGNRA